MGGPTDVDDWAVELVGGPLDGDQSTRPPHQTVTRIAFFPELPGGPVRVVEYRDSGRRTAGGRRVFTVETA